MQYSTIALQFLLILIWYRGHAQYSLQAQIKNKGDTLISWYSFDFDAKIDPEKGTFSSFIDPSNCYCANYGSLCCTALASQSAQTLCCLDQSSFQLLEQFHAQCYIFQKFQSNLIHPVISPNSQIFGIRYQGTMNLETASQHSGPEGYTINFLDL